MSLPLAVAGWALAKSHFPPYGAVAGLALIVAVWQHTARARSADRTERQIVTGALAAQPEHESRVGKKWTTGGEGETMTSSKTAAHGSTPEGAGRNLTSISPFFIVKDLETSIAYYRDRLGFQLDFKGPEPTTRPTPE